MYDDDDIGDLRSPLLPARRIVLGLAIAGSVSLVACGGSQSAPTAPSPGGSNGGIESDTALFALVTQTQPFASYVRFPDVDVLRSGTSAHQPLVRVSMNATAFAALQNGRLPAGSHFPNGSVLFKEVLPGQSGTPNVYTVMYKDTNNARAANGWLWAEFNPDGSVMYSVSNRGGACTGCHSLEQGTQHDLVRTFERQP